MPLLRKRSPLRLLFVGGNSLPTQLEALGARIPRVVDVQRMSHSTFAMRTRPIDAEVVLVDGRGAAASRTVQGVRADAPTTPVLFLAPDWDAVVPAMSEGATDFVLQTATAREILLRAQLLASASGRPVAILRRIGRLRLDRDARTLANGERVVSLSPIELKIFERLVLQPGEAVSRSDLERAVWRAEEVEQHPTNIAVVYISYLRRKLSKLGNDCTIRTVLNAGYVLDVEASAPEADEPVRGAVARRRRAR